MVKPRDPSSLPGWWRYSLLGNGTHSPAPQPPAAPRMPQGLLSYLEARNREANDNPPPSAPRHVPILPPASTPSAASTSISLDEAHRVENRWPVIDAKDERARRQSILENSPAIFRVGEYSYADGLHPVHALEQAAKALFRQTALGATLLRRIRDRLQDPNIQNIATLYNGLSKGNVTDYGNRVDEIYRTKEWNRPRFAGKGIPGDRGP
jgi:hypothetical protein